MNFIKQLFGYKEYKTLDRRALSMYCMIHPTSTVLAGIMEDFCATADVVFESGCEVLNNNAHTWSAWGTPCLYDETLDQFIPCYVLEWR
jgi:hypothetical protein